MRAAREKELTQKLREEVESVRRLQESVLPRNLVAPRGYRICARYEPAQIRVVGGHPVTMAGGDYYDVFTLPNNDVVLMVGDATGHGMKSCLSIMTLHTLVRMMRRREYLDTAHFVEEINKGLCEQSIVTEKGGFITLLYCILNAETQTLQWSAAGHHPPLLQDLTTGSIASLAGQEAGGPPLAADEESEYEIVHLQAAGRLPPAAPHGRTGRSVSRGERSASFRIGRNQKDAVRVRRTPTGRDTCPAVRRVRRIHARERPPGRHVDHSVGTSQLSRLALRTLAPVLRERVES